MITSNLFFLQLSLNFSQFSLIDFFDSFFSFFDEVSTQNSFSFSGSKILIKPRDKADVYKTFGDNKKINNFLKKKIKYTDYKLVQQLIPEFEKRRLNYDINYINIEKMLKCLMFFNNDKLI